MAKRFLDTEFFKKPLVRGFEGPFKLLYAFIICDSDNAGFWNPDCQVASIYIGFNVTIEGARKNFAGKYIMLSNGQWFFPGFIKHQYPKGLQNSNPAHKNIIEKLRAFDLLDNNLKIKSPEGPTKELSTPIIENQKGPMVMDKVMDKVIQSPDKKTPLFKSEIIPPWKTPVFSTAWQRWRDYKEKQHKFKFKSVDSEQSALNDLKKLSGGVHDTAIAIIEQSIAKGWKGFFELKMPMNGNYITTPQNGQPVKVEKQGFETDLFYIADRFCEPNFDDRLITADLYDRMTPRNFLQVGAMDKFKANTIDEKKKLAVRAWLENYKSLKNKKQTA